MKKLFNCEIIFLMILFSVLANTAVAGDWDVRSELDVTKPGITEAVLLPELLLQTSEGVYDISLSGPDGNPRPFELYMKEKTGTKEISLQPLKIELTDNGGFIWECSAPDKLLTDIRVTIADRNYVGKVHVEAGDATGWHYIARNQAVYQTSGTARAVIDVLDGNYNTLRLHFLSYDKRFKQKIVPIKEVTGFVKKTGKDYAYQKIDLTENIRLSTNNDFTEIKTLLPGKGLNLKSVVLETGIQFQGIWELGHETINHGKSEFVLLNRGNIAYVGSEKNTVTIKTDRTWPAKAMILRLKADTGYVGSITALRVNVRLPRIVFLADMKGQYRASTGAGSGKRILGYPGDSKRSAEQTAVFGQLERNPLDNTKALVDKYHLKGGPFHDAGYLWNSAVTILEPGYYKLKFNLKAGLDKDYKKVRLVKDGLQIPFFFGRNEDNTIELEQDSEYNAQKNKTSWIVTMPEISNQWRYLHLTSSGIFKRTVLFYKKKPGNTGWQKIYSRNWQNSTTAEAELRLEFTYLFKKQKKIKVEINHGDNQPLHIKSFKGVYSSPSINFLAHQAGDYFLFGGNGNASPAVYDLSLIQQRLLGTLPAEIEMREIEINKAAGWSGKFVQQFQEEGWGLYFILGMVTILLLGIIIRLFPAAEKKQIQENQTVVKEIDNKR